MSRAFDGTDDNVNFGDIPAIDDATTVSFVCWFRVNNVTQDHAIFGQKFNGGAGAGKGFYIFVDDNFTPPSTDNTIHVQFGTTGGTQCVTVTSANDVTAGAWISLFATMQAGVNPGTRIWKNLTEVTYAAQGTGVGSVLGGSSLSFLAGETQDINDDMAGNIAHIQVWDRIISINEATMATYYPGSIRTNLQLYAPLWGASSPEPDYSGNGNSGTVTGAIAGTTEPPINGLYYPRRSSRYEFVEAAAGGGLSIPVAMASYQRWRKT